MADWEGKSRGTPLGYRIFVFILSNFGVYPAYVLLTFVASYYVFFSPKTTPHILNFFTKRIGWSRFKAWWKLYVTYHLLGQTLIDRVAVSAGLSNKIKATSHGGEHLKALVENNQGGILLGSHFGNWGIAAQRLMNYGSTINVLVYDVEHEQIRRYLDSVTGGIKFNTIVIKNDLSHIYEIGEALLRKEIVCMTADRYLKGNRTVSANFFGEEALFPAGPFQLIKSFKAPYTFVYGVKAGATHYQCYAKPYRTIKPETSLQDIVNDYAQDLESMARQYPEQWFNYFDFWKK
jgi:predicted LPLAT superfamily acyltransferase